MEDPWDEDSGQGGLAVVADKPKLKEPPKFAVVLHNDDYTTMEFVIEVLQKFFRKNYEEATQVMLKIHRDGKGVAAVFTRDIAETKAEQVYQYAQGNGYPLKCTAEPIS